MNPITEMVNQRETLALTDHEKRLQQNMRALASKIKGDILDDFSIRLLNRYRGGLTQQQQYEALRDFKNSRTKNGLRKAFFHHIVMRNDKPHAVYSFEGDILDLFRVTMYAAFAKEQDAIADAYTQGTSMTVTAAITNKDMAMLRKAVIGGWSVKDYVKVALREAHDRLVGRLTQAIMVEKTPAQMIIRMRQETDKVLDTLAKRLKDYQFELVTYAANMAQIDFIGALKNA